VLIRALQNLYETWGSQPQAQRQCGVSAVATALIEMLSENPPLYELAALVPVVPVNGQTVAWAPMKGLA
jgi:hypothetical protein